MTSKGAATTKFATALYRELSATPGNLFFSPYSISTALAMCQAGASGVTRQEIEAALGHAGAGERLTEVSAEHGFTLSEVFHKALVEVDERGTEAGAATSMDVGLGSPRAVIFRVDRPSLFLIRDNPTATILFMGRVVDPSR